MLVGNLQIPDWVPDHVAAKARELHEAHRQSPIAVGVVERLMTDPRMRRVWHELAKRNRRSKARRHHEIAARFVERGIDEKAAIAGLLEFAFDRGRLTLMLPPGDNPRRPYRARAQRYRDEAEQLANDPGGQGIRQLLLSLAQRCEAVTLSAHAPSEAIAVGVAHFFESVFGSPKYTTTATITAVITGQNITVRKVRSLLAALKNDRSHPAKK